MKETIKIPFGVYYQEQFSKPMRRKQDVVSFILGVVNVLLVGESDSDSNGTLYLKRNKMNRVFCFMEGKYFSTVFPFDVEFDENGNFYKVYDSISDIRINNRSVALLERMLEKIDFEESSIDEIIEEAYLDVEEDGYTDKDIDMCFGLILRLLSTELGYIRYDYDPERENGRLHPLYHVDINYSTKGTYKLGMNKKMEVAEFIDMLDTKTDCRYVQ